MISYEELSLAEEHLLDGNIDEALSLLENLERQIEHSEYKSGSVFSFDWDFEKLLYQAQQSKKIKTTREPFARIYRDLAYCYMQIEDEAKALEALKNAVAWNPLDNVSRLNLAEIYKSKGNLEQSLEQAKIVLKQASLSEHLAFAYLHFARAFLVASKHTTAAAIVKIVQNLGVDKSLYQDIEDILSRAQSQMPEDIALHEAKVILQKNGLPVGANMEVVSALLISAEKLKEAGSIDLAMDMIRRTSDLIGVEKTSVLVKEVFGDDFDDEIFRSRG